MTDASRLISVDAERTILGAILLDNAAYDHAAAILRADDFGLTAHGLVFRRMGEMLGCGRSVDLITLGEDLASRAELDTIGGRAWLASLIEGVPRRVSIGDYVHIVREKRILRDLRQIGEGLASQVQDVGASAENLLGETAQRLLELRASTEAQRETSISAAIVPLLDRLQRERTRTHELLGLPTGIGCYDTVTRGLKDGEINIWGARSGVGKSAVMVQTGAENGRRGTPVLLFSLEMTREQILRRILSAVSGISFPRVRDPKWATEQDMEAIRRASEKIAEWPLHIEDASGITIDRLTAMARLAIRAHGVKLVAVDYAQIVSADGRDERLRVANVSRGLTRLAKDEGVPVLVLSQLARTERINANRRPTMSDLRESSQLENDAHCIALLHRPWDEEEGRLSSQAELIIAKQRSGETGVFPLTFDRRTLTFADAGQRLGEAKPAETTQRRA